MFKQFALACLAAAAQGISINQSASPYEIMLAQVQATKHTCRSTAQRGQMRSLTLAEVEAQISDGYRFVDGEFPKGDDALWWADIGETPPEDITSDLVKWTGLAQTFKPRGRTLFGDGISPDDINQGSLGNCWFLAAASAIAEEKGRMEKVFVNQGNELNAKGVYSVKFYQLGVPKTVTIDDYLPLYDAGGKLRTLFSAPGEDGSMWTAVLEKAFAKYHGNYKHIVGGDPGFAVRTMTGAPVDLYSHRSADVNAPKLWEKLVQHDKNKDIITCASPAGSDKTTSASGLVQGHAFTLLSTHVTSAGDKLVKIRNPHGSEKYVGVWSDKDARWTPELLKELNHSLTRDDGVFFMDIDTYVQQFSMTRVNYNTEGWGHDYHLQLNDKSSGKGKMSWCGSACAAHTITVRSEVAQEVYVTLNTWDKRSLPDSCKKLQQKSHSIGPAADGFYRTNSGGPQQLPVEKMDAGESKSFGVELDFTNPELPSDWSVTVWGSKGPVYVYNNDGTPSQAWEGAAPTKPALPGFDYSKYETWAAKYMKKSEWAGTFADTTKKEDGADDRKFVLMRNDVPGDYSTGLKFSFRFKKSDWDGVKYKNTYGGVGSFDDAVKCKDVNQGSSVIADCEVKLAPQQAVGFVLEPGFCGYMSWGYGAY